MKYFRAGLEFSAKNRALYKPNDQRVTMQNYTIMKMILFIDKKTPSGEDWFEYNVLRIKRLLQNIKKI